MSVEDPAVAEGRPRHPVGLWIAIALSWLLPVAAVVCVIAASPLPRTIPTHVGLTGQADGWSPTATAFWTLALPCFFAAAVITLVVVLFGDDIPRLAGGLWMGGATALVGGIALVWFAGLASAEGRLPSGDDIVVALAGGPLLGLLVFGSCMLPRRAAGDAP